MHAAFLCTWYIFQNILNRAFRFILFQNGGQRYKLHEFSKKICKIFSDQGNLRALRRLAAEFFSTFSCAFSFSSNIGNAANSANFILHTVNSQTGKLTSFFSFGCGSFHTFRIALAVRFNITGHVDGVVLPPLKF